MALSDTDARAYDAWHARLAARRHHNVTTAATLDRRDPHDALHLDTLEEERAELDALLASAPADTRLWWQPDLLLVCPRGCQTWRPTLRDALGRPLLGDCGACGSPMTLAGEEA